MCLWTSPIHVQIDSSLVHQAETLYNSSRDEYLQGENTFFLFFLTLTVTLNTVGNTTDRSMKFQQCLELKTEMRFLLVTVTCSHQFKYTWPHKLTSVDHLCPHVMHSFDLIYPFSPRVSRSLFSLSSLQLWMFVQVEWNHQDEKISLHSSFYSLWICGPHSIFCDSISFFLICFSFTVTA